ncbi:Histidinol-phosphate aminotransferase [Candidatus Bilamarchaeum dharawalense]|uniref:Aminotransferase n=1 Tax=Candidatus Bilamarchaeum dharawalense TaxID=2885759 RepID=A0A5E4LS44_9ARCH|nr:Histidinol-phosphate aminotransferase [Candidatus Bilamarchaeum dharawalense]
MSIPVALLQSNHGMHFREGRHGERAAHIDLIGGVVFDTTDAGRRIKHFTDNKYPFGLIEGRFGDPTCYPDLAPYSGYERHVARARFHSPRLHSSYVMGGDPALKEYLREGRKSPDNIQVPEDVGVFITAGVAGALRMISDATLLPLYLNLNGIDVTSLHNLFETGKQTETDVSNVLHILGQLKNFHMDNVVVPEWTYPSHLAETYRAHGQVLICPITPDGQIDIEQLKKTINPFTRTVLFATVGNPLSVAMEPTKFDEILRVVSAKMKEFNHPIIVVADTIYETFRRCNADGSITRIDPIQRALKLKDQLDPPVPVIATSSFSKMMAIPGQRVGYMRVYWDSSVFPNERYNFLKSLQLLYSPTLCPVSQHIQWALGTLYGDINANVHIDEDFIPIIAVLTALKKLKQTDLKTWRANVPAFEGTPVGYFSDYDISEMFGVMGNSFYDGDYGTRTTTRIRELCSSLKDVTVKNGSGMIKLIDVTEVNGKSFYRLVADIPDPPFARDDLMDSVLLDPNGVPISRIYGSVTDPDWAYIASRCGIKTEFEAYSEHKEHMRKVVFERTAAFARDFDSLRDLGIFMYPAYYEGGDPIHGKLVVERINAFYILYALKNLQHYTPHGLSQAARLVEEAVKVRGQLIANTPGELFLPPESRSDKTSYIRHVALQRDDERGRMIETLKKVARMI